MLQAVVFDFDGVIVNSEPLHYQAFLKLLSPLGVQFDYDHYLEQYIGFDDRDAIRAVCREWNIPLDDARLHQMIDAKADVFEQILRAGIDPCAGVIELIHGLSARYPLAICSGALQRDIDAILPAIGDGALRQKFGPIVAADHVARSKPDPEGYALAAKKLNIPPAHCLAIEDTPAGLAAARAAGLRTLAVAHTHPPEELRAHAEKVVPNFTGLDVDQIAHWYL